MTPLVWILAVIAIVWLVIVVAAHLPTWLLLAILILVAIGFLARPADRV